MDPKAFARTAGALPAGPAQASDAGPVRYWVAAFAAAAVALALSTQLLVQPHVWRNFGWDEILPAWLELLAHRLAVAMPIGMAIALATRVPLRSAMARRAALMASILAGAIVGEALLAWVAAEGLPAGWHWDVARLGQWLLLAASTALLLGLWQRTGALQAAAQQALLRRARIERQLVEAQLQTLRSQIEPHFLFNTLATIRRLHRTEQDEGARLLGNFLRYLGSTLPQHHEGVGALGQEIDLVKAYLGVIEVRMAGRLQVELQVDAGLRACEFPALALATLVENAIKHGIQPMPQGGRISIEARPRADGLIEVTVADTGMGFGETAGTSGTGIGLANIRVRLDTLYGQRAGLRLEHNRPQGVRAIIHMPRIAATAAAGMP
jgi:signal transduction histidine kinase